MATSFATPGRSYTCEWVEDGGRHSEGDDILNPWAWRPFQTLERGRTADGVGAVGVRQVARGRPFDARSRRARDRIHGAVGVMPSPLWVVLVFIAGRDLRLHALFCRQRRSARSPKACSWARWTSVVVVYAAPRPFSSTGRSRTGVGGLRPVAMGNETLDQPAVDRGEGQGLEAEHRSVAARRGSPAGGRRRGSRCGCRRRPRGSSRARSTGSCPAAAARGRGATGSAGPRGRRDRRRRHGRCRGRSRAGAPERGAGDRVDVAPGEARGPAQPRHGDQALQDQGERADRLGRHRADGDGAGDVGGAVEVLGAAVDEQQLARRDRRFEVSVTR